MWIPRGRYILTVVSLALIVLFFQKDYHVQPKDWLLYIQKNMPSAGLSEVDFDRNIDSAQLYKMVKEKAINKTIILSILESGFIDMALNLWESSYVRFNITNYLFVCLSNKTKIMLAKYSIPCFLYGRNFDPRSSDYGTPSFNEKVMVKTKMSYSVLKMGYATMIVDVDIVFLKNPLPYMTCKGCDLIVQNNTGREVNSGFYLVKPTSGGLALQKKSLQLSGGTILVNDQQIMNKIVQIYRGTDAFSIKVLDFHKFQPGCEYFGKNQVASKANQDGVVMVHNNWITGNNNKIYRFREMLLWEVDRDGYYSCESCNYLTYSSPLGSSVNVSTNSYRLARSLGYALNRLVIVPQFTCTDGNSTNTCNFLSFFNYPPDEARSRESVFLDHHKVPDIVKKSLSPIVIFNKTDKEILGSSGSIYIDISKEKFNIRNIVNILNSLDVTSYHVLRLGTLNNL